MAIQQWSKHHRGAQSTLIQGQGKYYHQKGKCMYLLGDLIPEGRCQIDNAYKYIKYIITLYYMHLLIVLSLKRPITFLGGQEWTMWHLPPVTNVKCIFVLQFWNILFLLTSLYPPEFSRPFLFIAYFREGEKCPTNESRICFTSIAITNQRLYSDTL